MMTFSLPFILCNIKSFFSIIKSFGQVFCRRRSICYFPFANFFLQVLKNDKQDRNNEDAQKHTCEHTADNTPSDGVISICRCTLHKNQWEHAHYKSKRCH